MDEGISECACSTENPRPANAGQRNPANLERQVRCVQCDGLSDQTIGARRVIKFAYPQYTPRIRLGKCSLNLPFAIAVDDRTTEHKNEHRGDKDDRTKVNTHAGRKPAQRQLPAMLHRFTFGVQGAADGREDFTPILASAPNPKFPTRAMDSEGPPQFARAVGGLLAAAGRGFFDGLFDRFTRSEERRVG